MGTICKETFFLTLRTLFIFLIIIFFISGILLSAHTIDQKISDLERKLKEVTGREKVHVLNDIAYIFYTQSPEKCIKYGNQALELSLKIKYKKGETIALNNIGLGNWALGNYQNAIEYYLKSLKINEKIGDKKGIAKSLNNIGIVYGYSSNYDKALEFFLKSFKIEEEIGCKKGCANSLNNTGLVYLDLCNYDKALEFFLKSFKIEEEIGYKKGSAYSLNNIGLIYLNLSNYDKALEFFLKSFKIKEELGEKRGLASSLNNIGLIYLNLSNYDKALEYFHKSWEITKEIGNKKGISASLKNIGNVYSSLSIYEKSLEYYQKSLKIYEEIGDKRGIAESLNNIGETYYKLNNFSESMKFFEKSIANCKEIGTIDILWEDYYGIASNYKHQKNFFQALNYYKKAIEIIEHTRNLLQLEEHKSGFLREKLKIYEKLISFLVQFHRKKPLKGYDIESYNYVEKAKARAFLDNLQETKVDIVTFNSDLREKQNKISREISFIMTRLRKSHHSKEDRKELFKKLEIAEDAYHSLINELRKKDPKYAQLLYPQPYNLVQVQDKLLDKKTAIIEYFLGEENSFMFLIKKENFYVYQLHFDQSLNELIYFYLKTLSPKKVKDFKGMLASQRLYTELILPFRNNIGKIENLIIIPDGILYYLPFESLISEGINLQGEKRRNIKYLIEDYKISYIPSASVLVDLLEKRSLERPKKDLLAFANPIYKSSLIDKIINVFRDYYLDQGFRVSLLPFTEKEVKRISGYFRGNRRDIYIRDQAREDKLKRLSLKDYKIIHFATHGFLDKKFSHRSALVLSLDKDPSEDGFLQAREIYQLKLNADMVVLSACQTGVGKLERGEGVFGLTRAFFYAGAKSVLSTLWNIYDKSSSDFMGYFYQHLSEGESKSQALRLAKLKMINSKYSHPFFWAAFIISGDCNSPINFKR